MTRHALALLSVTLLALLPALPIAGASASGWTLAGWNNLGMHCMDADFSVMSILPPYNTIHAQLVDPAGALVTGAGGITVTYEAAVDPAGSVNSTSEGKTNFWDHVLALFGASPPVDVGLAGKAMPGTSNTPQPMDFDPASGGWIAEGIPITPKDDAFASNPYPMMHLVARDASGAVLATTDVVLPVSDEMDCRACHASGSGPDAEPAAGWVDHPDPQLDYRLNVLLLHDEKQIGTPLYDQSLLIAGYSSAGLHATAALGGTPILCARCHASNALPGSGIAGISALTAATHGLHATVIDPLSGQSLDSEASRSACYRCHPGSATRCLRGAMGSAVAADGTRSVQCQSCHGSMSKVGDPGREGWLEEPSCQSCHTGTALTNSGEIRYTSAFDSSGNPRVAADDTFATNANTPGPGLSLYRFSRGHGGLQCSACHGSTHAEYPSSHSSDNVQSIEIQGHAGPLAECTACHAAAPLTVTGGPHGMHPLGQSWVHDHQEVAEHSGTGPCRKCHGTDFRGSVLSRARNDRTLSTGFGTRSWWGGFEIGCYACHRGPSSDERNRNRSPVVQDAVAISPQSGSVAISLVASDPDGDRLTLRIVSQPDHGTVGLSGVVATYHPEPGFQGLDAFSFAAWDGAINSNLGIASVTVGPGTCTMTCSSTVPGSAPEGTAVSFQAAAAASGCSGAPSFAWEFGDGLAGSGGSVTHLYPTSGSYGWIVHVTADSQTCTRTGTIAIQGRPPEISRVKRLGSPFRILLTGSNLHSGVTVEIGGMPWTSFVQKGATLVELRKGPALKALFPPGVFVPIRITNPDDGLDIVVEYNRTTNQWRVST